MTPEPRSPEPPSTEPDPDDLESELDEALEETFPASDPVSVNPQKDHRPKGD
ncbi:MAG TPA: hypothetical protein VL358_02215 [Caulobacteraceae bacterium]|jgi:hypothetical protein|nr:hypothetical protein [Caulobacteraceae bacterium]